MNGISEADWKVLSKLKPLALERLCRRILERVTAISANGEDGAAHEHYLRLYQYIQDVDQEIVRGFDDWRRATAVMKLVIWHQEGLITGDEFLQFSEALQSQVNAIGSKPL